MNEFVIFEKGRFRPISHNERYPKPKTTPLANPMPITKDSFELEPGKNIYFTDKARVYLEIKGRDGSVEFFKEDLLLALRAMGILHPKEERKVIQLSVHEGIQNALCDDGRIYYRDAGSDWKFDSTEQIPQD